MAALYSSVLLITLLLLELVTYLVVQDTLRRSLDDSLENQLNWLSKTVEKEMSGSLRREQFEDIVAQNSLLTPLKMLIQVHDPDGNIFYKSPNLGAGMLLFEPPTSGHVEFATLASSPDITVRAASLRTSNLVICVASPVERYTTPVKLLFLIFLLMTPAVILFSALGGYAVAKVSLRPIDEITRTARRITVENLNHSLPEPESDDEVGRLASTFNEMLSRLHAAVEQAKQFPGNVAHELRTSLTVIRSWLNEALVSDLSADQVRKMAASSLDEVNRMANIVEALFTLSKTDLGKIRQEFKETQLDEVVAGLHWESVILAQVKKIRVTLKKLDRATILGDEKLIRQLFLNLIDNAIKYNHERGTIRLSLERINPDASSVQGRGPSDLPGEVQLIISDSGIGVPPEDLGKVFERFYRTKEARSIDSEGVGLGLAIVKWIVEVHNGKIAVESTPSVGTTFTITLPTIRVADEEKNIPQQS